MKNTLEGLTRREFMFIMGALSLSACGGGSVTVTTYDTTDSTATLDSTTDSTATLDGTTDSTGILDTTGSFVHPGLLHTQTDLARMAAKVANNESPWVDSWNILIANSHANLDWTPQPQEVVYRNVPPNKDNSRKLFNDVAAAYACALRWKLSGDSAYADKAVEIMNAWSSTLTEIAWKDGYHDGWLVAGIQGYQFANAAEIMRDYAGWAAQDFARFQTMMMDVFHQMNSYLLPNGSTLRRWSNWELCALAAILATSVLCDNRSLFDEAINYFKSGAGNGCIYNTVNYIHPGYLGQTQEAGRDQGHNTLSMMLLSTICEMAWNQGVDLYGFDNNRVLAGAEYVSKGNLIESGSSYYQMPFARYFNGLDINTEFATAAQGTHRAGWALIYHHYVNRKGLAAPYTRRYMLATQPEGGGGNYGNNSGGFDQLGYTTLTGSRDPIAVGAVPSGLTAYVTGGDVILSWWGTAYASSYNLKRSSTAGGPYTQIASNITDPLTYTDSGLPGGTYYYVVTAITANGESDVSNEARAITSVQLHTHLAFDEGSGTIAADSSDGAHSATLHNAVWASGHKATGNAISFDGSNAYASLPDDLLLDVADFTIAAWVYWNGGNAWQRIFDLGAGQGRYMYLTPKSNRNTVRFSLTTNSEPDQQVIVGTRSLPVGVWTHVAVTLAGSVGTLYVDGVAVGTKTDMTGAPFRLGNTSQNWLGRSQFSTNPNFNGLIEDFRIYYGVLSETEIQDLMQ